MATAYAGLFLLAVSLIKGPWNVLRGGQNFVSSYERRDFGIWAGAIGILHMILGLQGHLSGRIWLYFIYPPD
jgi:sulfoxide reductase heme-binding subunit YedZ